MEEDNFINMECNETKFFVSQVTKILALHGLKSTMQAWNNHPIPGIKVKLEQVPIIKKMSYTNKNACTINHKLRLLSTMKK